MESSHSERVDENGAVGVQNRQWPPHYASYLSQERGHRALKEKFEYLVVAFQAIRCSAQRAVGSFSLADSSNVNRSALVARIANKLDNIYYRGRIGQRS